MTDPIADMLTRLRNAVSAKHTRVDMPASRLKADIARILQDEGYIQGFKLLDNANGANAGPVKTLRVFLKYGPHGEKLITGIERISRPGRRVYFGRDDGPGGLAGTGGPPPPRGPPGPPAPAAASTSAATMCPRCWRDWGPPSSRRRAG